MLYKYINMLIVVSELKLSLLIKCKPSTIHFLSKVSHYVGCGPMHAKAWIRHLIISILCNTMKTLISSPREKSTSSTQYR